jgi:AcrR family transcriptional regulator
VSNKSYHHGDLKEALISSARKILTEQGADALSLRAIASDVGVSHMAPYAHFKNKKALFKSIAAGGFRELSDKMLLDSQDESKPQDLILAYGATYVAFAIDNPQLYRLMLGQVENTGRRNQDNNSRSNKGRSESEEIGLDISLMNSEASTELESSSTRPFILLQDAFAKANKNDNGIQTKAQAVGAWAMVHGMAALIIEGHFTIPETMSLKEFLKMTAVQSPR